MFGADYPKGHEYRKHWEVVQAARTFRYAGLLNDRSEMLGIGAGNEPTVFWLTNHVGTVHATDLYLSEGWEESANVQMLIDPGRNWRGEWKPQRLVVQHMNALDLRYEDESFDGVFSSSSIEHFGDLSDVRRSIEEVRRVLRPGGIFSVSTELLLEGSASGLPGILMFNWDQIEDLAAGWDWVGEVRREPPQVAPVSFLKAAEVVSAHFDQYGEIIWDKLHWPEYPHIVLESHGLTWTSVHLALRKR
jgi:SAM-dependent methyltransferase